MIQIKNPLHFIASVIVIVGALNWLAIGLFNKNPVHDVIGHDGAKFVYDIVGFAGVYLAVHKIMWLSGVEMPAVVMPKMYVCEIKKK
jgi:uncharacterized membrane protein YuzA (DUF378 family)